jgi:hypothetical protein
MKCRIEEVMRYNTEEASLLRVGLGISEEKGFPALEVIYCAGKLIYTRNITQEEYDRW